MGRKPSERERAARDALIVEMRREGASRHEVAAELGVGVTLVDQIVSADGVAADILSMGGVEAVLAALPRPVSAARAGAAFGRYPYVGAALLRRAELPIGCGSVAARARLRGWLERLTAEVGMIRAAERLGLSIGAAARLLDVVGEEEPVRPLVDRGPKPSARLARYRLRWARRDIPAELRAETLATLKRVLRCAKGEARVSLLLLDRLWRFAETTHAAHEVVPMERAERGLFRASARVWGEGMAR